MLYGIARVLAWIVLKAAFFIRVEGRQNYAHLRGAYIVICNHVSNWDPIVLGYSIRKRPVHYLAKQELFSNKLAGFFLRHLYAVPVTRGAGDVTAVKTALTVLKEGGILGIFPEGTRTHDEGLSAFEPGAALLALRSGAPVLPVYISGDYRLFHRVTVHIGDPIDLGQSFPGKTNAKRTRDAAGFLRDKMLRLAGSASQTLLM